MLAAFEAITRSPGFSPSGTDSAPSLEDSTRPSTKARVTSTCATPWTFHGSALRTTASSSPTATQGTAANVPRKHLRFHQLLPRVVGAVRPRLKLPRRRADHAKMRPGGSIFRRRLATFVVAVSAAALIPVSISHARSTNPARAREGDAGTGAEVPYPVPHRNARNTASTII